MAVKRFLRIMRLSALPVLMLTAVLFLSSVTLELNYDKADYDRKKLEETLNNAAVGCYAVEGAYPPDIDYLIENYRVQVNSERYTVMYEIYASNLMPSNTVLENAEK